MRISKQARRDAKKLFQSCLVGGVLDESRVRQVVEDVVRTKPRSYLTVLHFLQRLVKLELERRTARIETAAPLSPEQQSRILANLERLYGPGLTLESSVKPELIGGLRIRIGSDVYDGSIQGRLTELQETF
jgi:F-type H+-transporting ATPase subunit delta